MEPWHREIVELHDFFEAYFRGTVERDDIARADAVLAPEFTIVGPTGSQSSRAETIAAIQAAHSAGPNLTITVRDAQLLAEADRSIVARYVERHESPSGTTDRLSTVVFERSLGTPNNLVWQTVHETWVPAPS